MLKLWCTSNKNLMKTHIIIKVLFIDKTTDRNMHHLLWCVGLFVLTTSRILEKFLKLLPTFKCQRLIRYQYFVLSTAMAKNPSLHKYDVTKGIIIHSAFFIKARYSSSNEIQKCVRFPESHFLFREPLQVRSM